MLCFRQNGTHKSAKLDSSAIASKVRRGTSIIRECSMPPFRPINQQLRLKGWCFAVGKRWLFVRISSGHKEVKHQGGQNGQLDWKGTAYQLVMEDLKIGSTDWMGKELGSPESRIQEKVQTISHRSQT
ncbi:hypothetical protein L3X38_044465 [Prunus dulcis]|uniref:Uncharacterized protein n=1 Tax=Prunus dulcis TaxID=3755 RepID=A0AAD4V016_PRUDU|nr:hypothetical protein L3X38_044465 [Prunus dulcis]